MFQINSFGRANATATKSTPQRLVYGYHMIQLLCRITLELEHFLEFLVGSCLLLLVASIYSSIKLRTTLTFWMWVLVALAPVARFSVKITQTSAAIPHLLMSNPQFKKSPGAKYIFRA